jgi:F-type H+-transporting ATPase subunit epsilon
VSALVSGTVSVAVPEAGKDGKVNIVVTGGYAQICDNKVIVLANDALAVSDIDVAAVREGLADVEGKLASLKDGDAELTYYKSQKAWYELQLHAVSAE